MLVLKRTGLKLRGFGALRRDRSLITQVIDTVLSEDTAVGRDVSQALQTEVEENRIRELTSLPILFQEVLSIFECWPISPPSDDTFSARGSRSGLPVFECRSDLISRHTAVHTKYNTDLHGHLSVDANSSSLDSSPLPDGGTYIYDSER